MDDERIDPIYKSLLGKIGFNVRALIRCKVRLLMVTDGAHYTDFEGLHLSELLAALESESTMLKVEATRAAHHSCVKDCDGAKVKGLRFDKINLSKFDEVWLFGVKARGKGEGLLDDEVEALSDFMEKGGGVFATGDHESLGFALCGRVPRVRSMRAWVPEPSHMFDNPINTVVGDECCDAIPQVIYPKTYRSPYDWAFASRICPHPILCGPQGPIEVLPDHEHEGLIEVPSDLGARTFSLGGAEVPEYPELDGAPWAPEVIATAINQRDKTSFGAIGAYDGHVVKRGRVVVDSTWHHFVNQNLNQFRRHYKRVQLALGSGSVPDPESLRVAKDYSQMRAYFRNIARWLARPKTQLRLWWRVLCSLRWHSSINMALRSEVPDNAMPYFLDLGVKARQALARVGSDQDFLCLSKRIAERSGLGESLGTRDSSIFSVIDPDLVACVCMGGALHALGQQKVEPEVAKLSAKDGFKLVRKGVTGAVKTVGKDLGGDLKGLKGALKKAKN